MTLKTKSCTNHLEKGLNKFYSSKFNPLGSLLHGRLAVVRQTAVIQSSLTFRAAEVEKPHLTSFGANVLARTAAPRNGDRHYKLVSEILSLHLHPQPTSSRIKRKLHKAVIYFVRRSTILSFISVFPDQEVSNAFSIHSYAVRSPSRNAAGSQHQSSRYSLARGIFKGLTCYLLQMCVFS